MVTTVEEVGMRKRSGDVVPGETTSRRAGARRTPLRTCVVCRSTTAKRTLHRIVRSPSGTVAYDPTGSAAGRGAYLCGQPSCLDLAVRRRSILRALKVTDAAAANAAVEALRNECGAGRAGQPASRPSDDEEVRSG
jgi:predicted RNA-binding protein YlxR (DUF448 family)